MKKFYIAALMSLAILAFTPTQAQADCCYDSCECLDIDVGADFLWWKPCAGDLTYAAENNDQNWKLKNICLDREPGFRVFAFSRNVLFGWDLQGSYTYFNTSSTSSIEESGSIASVNAHPGLITAFFDEGKGKWESRYHDWDVLFSFNNSCNECHELNYLFGVAGMKFDREFTELLHNNQNQNRKTKWSSDFWGAGLRAGMLYNRRMTDCISFYAKGHATIVAGNARSEISFEGNDAEVNIHNTFDADDHCYIVPGYHLGTGFVYDTHLCGYNLAVRLGYEFVAWHNLPSHRTFVKDGEEAIISNGGALSTVSNARVIGFHGLNAGVQLTF